jgi:hypothetical protein
MPRLEGKSDRHVPVIAGEESFSKDVRNLCTVWNQNSVWLEVLVASSFSAVLRPA